MHRNTSLSLGIILVAFIALMFCSCNGSGTTNDLTGMQGVWDYTATGTGNLTNYYSVGPRKLAWEGVYSITPTTVKDRQGYDWDWLYNGQTLTYKMLQDIPVDDTVCGGALIEGEALFTLPMAWGATSSNGVMTLNSATVTCNNTGLEGNITGTFSIFMVKR